MSKIRFGPGCDKYADVLLDLGKARKALFIYGRQIEALWPKIKASANGISGREEQRLSQFEENAGGWGEQRLTEQAKIAKQFTGLYMRFGRVNNAKWQRACEPARREVNRQKRE